MVGTEITWGYGWIVALVSVPVGVLLLAFLLYRLGRVERAMWAVVSQLQALRRELPDAVTPAVAAAPEPTVPRDRHVLLSMFGR